uniref:Defective in cullin neddylation protein n=1 Tax=Vannella robusta TaxID=1487602 RepID=A0A7S4IJW6_9EUKA|mmetsp:Transcript_375/g.495  ORF Transcript_375/g.495 Transcript_375/m.495 type:complete len:174 (+) Transcript_375:140-661(+)
MSSRTSSRQKQVILKNFLAVTDNVSESAATKFLQKYRWDLETAMNQYFENPQQLSKSKVSVSTISKIFEHYKDSTTQTITEDGFDKFVEDLAIQDDDIVQFVFAWECSCKKISVFTLEEFQQGFMRLQCDSVKNLKAKLPLLRKKIEQPKVFKEFYNWFFVYAKASEEKKGLC